MSSGQLGSNGSESEGNIVDSLLYDIRTGFSVKKDVEPKVTTTFIHFIKHLLSFLTNTGKSNQRL